MKKINLLVIISTLFLLITGNAFSQGVELNPAYVSGSITYTNGTYTDNVSGCTIYAYSTEGNYTSTTSTASDGTFTITLNTPADGTEREYRIRCRIALKSGMSYYTNYQYITVTKDQIVSDFDFTSTLQNINFDFPITNGTSSRVRFYIYGNSNYNYITKNLDSATDHIQVSIQYVTGIPAQLYYYYVYPTDTSAWQTYYENVNTTFTAEVGTEWSYEKTITFSEPPPPVVTPTGTINGSISITGLPEALTLQRNYSSYPSTSLTENPGTYSLTYNAGTVRRYSNVYTLMRNEVSGAYYYLYWPARFMYGYQEGSSYPEYIVPEDGTVEVVDNAECLTYQGRINISGVLDTSKLTTSSQIYFQETDYSSNLAGYLRMYNFTPSALDSIVAPLFEGVYYPSGNLYISDTSAAVDDYINGRVSYSMIGEKFTFDQTSSLEFHEQEVPTGSVKIKFAVSDGSLISSPYLSFSYYDRDEDNQTLNSGSGYFYGSSTAVQESQATIIGPPGEYTINARATVNGSTVTFNPKTVLVIGGVEQVLEINGPSLAIITPSAESYTYDESTEVSGIATGDSEIVSVTVNGEEIAFESTGNTNSPNEISFATEIPLETGPNQIQVIVTDALDKIAQDVRYIYQDGSEPTVEFTPAAGTTNESTVTVLGTATDDNEITKILVNGSEVTFTSTGNTDDPNEVEFSTTVNLNDGANLITVIAYDNSKRSTTVTHNITKQDQDTTAPVFTDAVEGVLPSLTLEQTSPAGTAYVLTDPEIFDESAVTLSSNAPDVFLPGSTTVTWTAVDSWENQAIATQVVNVADTIAPVLTAPAELTWEYSGVDPAIADLGEPVATDAADDSLDITALLPESFILGDNEVLWTAIDDAGNSTEAVQNVIVQDTTAPAFGVLEDVILEQTSYEGTYMLLDTPVVTDIYDPIPVVTAEFPEIYPAGTTQIVWTATDVNGNQSQAVQNVIVQDTTPPEILQPEPVTVEQTSTAGTPVTLIAPQVIDFADPSPVITSNAPALFPVGTTEVVWTATDASGNSASVTQLVTVLDRTPPVFGTIEDLTFEQETYEGTAITLPVPQVTDNIDPSPAVTSDAPSIFGPGTTIVTWTAVDAAGNQSEAVQKITVVDTLAPVFETLPLVTLEATSPNGVTATLPAPVVTDKADPAPVLTSDAPATFPMGTTIVTWTATDKSGNVATAEQTVEVADTTSPVLRVCVWPRILPDKHKLMPVSICYYAYDSVDGNISRNVELVSVTSDEPAEKQPYNKHHKPDVDIVIINNHLVLLRAEADKRGDGRVYTLNYKVTDSVGNITTESVKVEVRKRFYIPAVDSGVAYTVTERWKGKYHPGHLKGFDCEDDRKDPPKPPKTPKPSRPSCK